MKNIRVQWMFPGGTDIIMYVTGSNLQTCDICCEGVKYSTSTIYYVKLWVLTRWNIFVCKGNDDILIIMW